MEGHAHAAVDHRVLGAGEVGIRLTPSGKVHRMDPMHCFLTCVRVGIMSWAFRNSVGFMGLSIRPAWALFWLPESSLETDYLQDILPVVALGNCPRKGNHCS